jgi:hypothetical protein
MTAITADMVGRQARGAGKAKANPARRKSRKAPSPAQLAARQRFADMARAGKFTKGKRKANPPRAARKAPAKRAPPRVTLPVDPRSVNPESRVRGRRPKDAGRHVRVYEVYTNNPKTQGATTWTRQATFYAESSARRYANALHKAEPNLYVRLESHG